jgi:demethylmenaquinone methyltransferase/2-methoxy-6-polyprenyl-1,4-benzoquinol methylase
MFDAIAPRYDFLNHLLSAGLDYRWRARAVRALGLTGRELLLDVCTGTADLAIAASRAAPDGIHTIGVDASPAMLAVAERKIERAELAARVRLVRADATRLPVPSASVDGVTVAFGIRNVQDLSRACHEMCRALRPGGRLVVLEFGIPRLPGIRTIYLSYFRYVLPVIGRLISRDRGAYAYLPASVDAFPEPDEFARFLQGVGFSGVSFVPLTFGIVNLYTAIK